MKIKSVLLICVLFFLSCHTTPKIDPLSQIELDQLKTRTGELKVVFFSPKGESTTDKKITVNFDQPMVALESYQEELGSAPLQIEPKIEGKFRWLGSQTLLFDPKDRLPYATQFTVVIPQGTKSLLDKTLLSDFVFSFTTPQPKIEKIFPASEAINRDTKEIVYLLFNQPINIKKLQESLKVTATDAEGRDSLWPVSVEKISDDEQEKNIPFHEGGINEKVKIIPVKPYPLEGDITVTIDQNLKGAEGSLTLGQIYKSRFKIHGPFEIEKLSCENQCYPSSLPDIYLSTSVDGAALAQAIQIVPSLKQAPQCYYSSYDHLVSCTADLNPQTEYNLTILKGLKDDFGQELAADFRAKFSTGSYSPAFSFTGGHGILEANGAKEYYAHALNIRELNVRMTHIDEGSLVAEAFKMTEEGGSRDPLEGFTTSDDWIEKVNIKKDNFGSLAIPVKGAGKGAFVLMDVTSPEIQILDNDTHQNIPLHHSALIQVTDLGITAKWSPKNSLVWVTKLSDGKPLSNVDLKVFDRKAHLLWEGSSDASGVAMLPGRVWMDEKIKSFLESAQNEGEGRAVDFEATEGEGSASNEGEEGLPNDYLVLAQTTDDKAFMLSSWSDGFNVWDFDLAEDYAIKSRQNRVFIFTERGVYRPGETVHIKGMVREFTNGLPIVPHDTGEIIVSNFSGDEISRQSTQPTKYGSFTLDLPLSEDAQAGTYTINYSTNNHDVETRGSGSFSVDYYRPQEFKVTLKNNQEDVVQGGNITGEVRAEYLFGAPMKKRDLTWNLSFTHLDFAPPGQPEGYSWQKDWEEKSPDTWMNTYHEAGEGSGQLDEDGSYLFKSPVMKEEFDEPRRYTWEVSVEDINHQVISEKEVFTVHPAEIYLGIRQAAYFAETGNVTRGFIRAASIDGKTLPDVAVQAKWKKIEWHSVRKPGFRGVYTYETERVVKDVKECVLKTKNEDVSCDFKPDTPGLYLLAARAQDSKGNKVYSSSAIYVTGSAYGGWKPEDSHQLILKADKKNYHPGDIAKVMVESPFEQGYALVTQERGGIITKQVMTLQGYAPTLDIPIVPEQIPNTFVSVVLVNGRLSGVPVEEADDRGKPSVHVGLIELPVESDELEFKVEVKTDREVYQPGDEVGIHIKATDASGIPVKDAELTLMVVDQGVLRVTGYQLPSPLDYFYAPQGLAVGTSDSRIYLIGKRALAAKMNSAAAGGGMETGFRQQFIPTAYWNPQVITNDKGEAVANFKLPDNLTTFQVMVVGLFGDNQFGSGETEFKTEKDLMIRPAMPRFGRAGDVMTVGAIIHNESDNDFSVKVVANFDGAKLLSEANKEVKVKAHGLTRVDFKIEVENASDMVASFKANTDTDHDALLWKIPVSYPKLMEHVVVSGSTDTSSRELLKKPQDIYDDRGGVHLQLASTPLVGFAAELEGLNKYPYSCLEQKISKIYPYLLAIDWLRDYGIRGGDVRDEKIKKLLVDLSQLQVYDGGFKYWKESWYPSIYLSSYVGSFLADAMQAGFKVDPDTTSQLIKFLQLQLSQTKKPGEELSPDQKFYAVKALINLKQPVQTWFETLFAGRDQLSLAARAQLLDMMKKQNPLDDRLISEWNLIENQSILAGQEAYFEEKEPASHYIDGTTRETTAIITDLMLHQNPEHPLIEKTIPWLIHSFDPGQWVNTQETLLVLRTLNDYHRIRENKNPDFAALVQRGTETILQSKFVDYNMNTPDTFIPPDKLAPDETFTFSKKGEGTLHYVMDLTYARKKHLFSIDNGMTVCKRFENAKGEPVKSFKAGELYAVRVNMVLEADAYQLALDDPLPAGFEPVNPHFMGTPSTYLEKASLQGVTENWSFEYLVSAVERRDDSVLVFADYVPAGSYDYVYYVRATTSGQYEMPATRVGEMYAPEIFGQSISGKIEVR